MSTLQQNSISIAFPNSQSSYSGTSILDSCLASGKPLQLTLVQFSEDIGARINSQTNNWSPSTNYRVFDWAVPANTDYNNYILSNISISTGQPITSSAESSSNDTLNIKISLDENFPETANIFDANEGIGWDSNYGISQPGSTLISLGSFAIYATNWTDPNTASYLLLCGWYDSNTVQSFATTSSVLGNVLNLNLLLQFTSLSQDIGNITYVLEENPIATVPQIPSIDNLPLSPTSDLTTANSYVVRTSNNLNKPVLAFRDNTPNSTTDLPNIWGFANYHPYTDVTATDATHPIYIQSLQLNPTSGPVSEFDLNSPNFLSPVLSNNINFTKIFLPTNGTTLNLTGQLLIVLDENNFNIPINENFLGASRVITTITDNAGVLTFGLSTPFSSVYLNTGTLPTFTLYVRNGINF